MPPKKITARKKSAAAALRRQAEARLSARTPPAAPATQVATQRLVHELQVHQIELEMQNEEPVQARAESGKHFDPHVVEEFLKLLEENRKRI